MSEKMRRDLIKKMTMRSLSPGNEGLLNKQSIGTMRCKMISNAQKHGELVIIYEKRLKIYHGMDEDASMVIVICR
jgi:hypothetical protein